MKRHFLLLAILLAFGILNAQGTFRFRTNHPQGFSIESSSAAGLSLHYSLSEIGIADIDNGEVKGHEIILKGSFGSFTEGLPNLPFENRYIAVPHGATASIEVKAHRCRTLNGIELLPAATLLGNDAVGLPKLRKDMRVFGKDANFPDANVVIAETTQIRGLDVVLLSVTPFRYNPVRKTLEVIYDMDIEVRFEGGNGQFGEARYRNPDWDHILRDLVINGDILPEAHYYDLLNEAIRNKEEGCEYLIIAPDDDSILACAETLKNYRTRQGILTKVVSTAECGNGPDLIRNYVRNAYENWAIPPAALLMFGDFSTSVNLSTYLYTMTYWDNSQHLYGTDNPIADMNGDSIPDIAYSRLTATTPAEFRTQINKLMRYELSPSLDPHFYDHPTISSGCQTNNWFIITSQIFDSFCRNKLGKHPTDLYMVYNQANPDAPPPTSEWSTAYNTESVLAYFGHEGLGYLPEHISDLNDWKHMYETDLLVNSLNEGSFLTLYRDHSHEVSWACPYFYLSDIATLENDYPTFVLSIGCNTNNYMYHSNSRDCFATTFNKSTVGSIGVIGAASLTHSLMNDILTWGIIDYFWPDFMPDMGSTSPPEFVRPSFALTSGKIFLKQQDFIPYSLQPSPINQTLNLFCYLGETCLNLYTELPTAMDIPIEPYQIKSQHDITFSAEEDAIVCIARNNEILHLTRSTGQPMTFSLPEMEAGEQYQVTVTKKGRIRFQQDVTIIPDSGPYLILEGYALHDASNNGILEFDEEASFDLTLFNAGVGLAENTEINLFCESPFVEIMEGTALCPRLEHDEQITLHDALRIKVSHDIPDQTKITCKIILDNGTVVQEIAFQKTVSAPILGIQPVFTLLKDDGQPTTHILNEGVTRIGFKIKNTGHCDSGPVVVDFEVLAPFVTVETQHFILDKLIPDSLTDLTLSIITQPNDIDGAWLKTRLSINDGSTEAVYQPTIQYGGLRENFETDTLNPFFTWENYVNYPWYYTEADAAEGQRCFEVKPPKNKASRLLLSTEGYIPEGTLSFYFKTGRYSTDALETLSIKETTTSGSTTQTISSEEWSYKEFSISPECTLFTFQINMRGEGDFGVRLDDICFPPPHIPIAFAGHDLISCKEAAIKLDEAYAYDCDAVYWSTDGDGHFEDEAMVNTQYHPGAQDLANGAVTLTLHALDSVNSMTSALMITLLDEIHLEGSIVGDSIVNKYSNPVSHYSVEPQEGINYLWQLEPAEAGVIYDFGHEVDIFWNQHEGDAEVSLILTADNGCDNTPVSKRISLIGYSTSEWHVADFDLFPNPTDGKVNLVVGETLQGKVVIEVYNLLGERMFTKNFYDLQKGEALSLDLNHLVSGLYIIKLSTNNGSCTKKVSVKLAVMP